MRFEVPQFIEIEDKIFGPFTWRQFLYLGGAIGAAVAMYILLPFFLFLILSLLVLGLAGALSFYPVNNRPFSYFLEAMVNYIRNARLYKWHQKQNIIYTETKRQSSPNVLSNKPKTNLAARQRELELTSLQKPQ